jgi:hypothetical protein
MSDNYTLREIGPVGNAKMYELIQDSANEDRLSDSTRGNSGTKRGLYNTKKAAREELKIHRVAGKTIERERGAGEIVF